MTKQVILHIAGVLTKSFLLIILITSIVYQLSTPMIVPIKLADSNKVNLIKNDLKKLGVSNNDLHDISKSIKVASEVTNIDNTILTAVAFKESRMDKNAKSRKGYKGIMQATQHDVYEFSIVDIIRGAKKLESWIKYRNGNLTYALASYNGGTNPPKSSFIYAHEVIQLARSLNNNNDM
jgi:soluble lytic murein transglycosylase-like protein